MQSHASSLYSSGKSSKKKKIGAGKSCESDSDDSVTEIPHKGKKSFSVHVKHEFPNTEGKETTQPASDSSISSAVKQISFAGTGLSDLERLAKQRETLNQLLELTTEDSTEWNSLKTKIKANLYRQLSLLEDEEV